MACISFTVQILSEVSEDYGARPALLWLIETCAARSGAGARRPCRDSEGGLIGRRIPERRPRDPNHCPSVCPDNVICPLSAEYQMSVMSTEINLMSPEDMQLIF